MKNDPQERCPDCQLFFLRSYLKRFGDYVCTSCAVKRNEKKLEITPVTDQNVHEKEMADVMKPPQQNLSERVMEAFNKFWENPMTVFSDRSGVITEEQIKHGLETFLLSTLQDVEKQVLGVVGEDEYYCTSGCGCSYPSGNGMHERSCVWERDENSPVSLERSRLRTAIIKLFRGEK